MEKVQLYGIYKGEIKRRRGKKSFVDIKNGTGICYDPVKGRTLFQVFDMNKQPILRTKLTFPGKYIVIIPNRAVKISRKIKDPEERERLYALGKQYLKRYGILFRSSAVGKEEKLVEEIEGLYEEVEKILSSSELFSAPSVIRKGKDILKIYFGWEAKKKLDELRGETLPTIKNHHLYKTMKELSTAVDLGEKLNAEGVDKSLVETTFVSLFAASLNEYLKLVHVKEYPVVLGDAEVIEFEPPKLILKRTFFGKGYYDGLEVKKEFGDYAITEIEEGKWYLVHTYYSKDDELKGRYYNICTPVEVYLDKIRYFDLEIDVVEGADGQRSIIDEDVLKRAVENEIIGEKLSKKALSVAKELVS
jgi:hypothetical protein